MIPVTFYTSHHTSHLVKVERKCPLRSYFTLFSVPRIVHFVYSAICYALYGELCCETFDRVFYDKS